MWRLIAVFTFSVCGAVDPISSAIEEAQSLALRKHRQEASRVLNKAIVAATPPLRGRGKLIDAQGAIAKMFFTDKGQKLFEAAQSAMFDNPDMAMNQYKEALALEDDNILVLANMARVQIAKQDCTGAALNVQRARSLFPYAPEPALLELQILLCQKNFDGFREKLKMLPILEKSHDMYLQYLMAQDFLQQKLWRKSIETLTKVTQDDPQFPEAYFYLTKAAQESSHDIEAWAQKYVSLCKAAGLRERKKYALEPRLCANVKEVEDDLAKKSTEL